MKVFSDAPTGGEDFEGSKEFSFKWSLNNLRKKLEIRETIACKPFQIKGDDEGDVLGLKLSFIPSPYTSSLMDFRPSLEILFSTFNQDLTIFWTVAFDRDVGNELYVNLPFRGEFKMKKWTIKAPTSSSKKSSTCSNHVIPVHQLTTAKENVIILEMEVQWSNGKRSDMSLRHNEAESFNQINSMLEERKYTDFKLVCGDRQFSCHKVVLAARSPVFDAMLSNENHLEVQKGKVNITDMDHDKLEVFLKYLYTGNFSDHMKQHAKELLVAADKYQVEGLKLAAEEALADNIISENAIDMLLFANDMPNANVLKKKAMKVIIANYDTISKQQQWQDFKKENIDFVNLIEISVESFSI